MTAAGDVSDYDAAAQSSLVSNMATTLNVPVADVSLTVTAASVRLLFVVAVADATAAQAVESQADATLPTAAAASAALGASIETDPVAATVQAAASPPSPATSPPPPPPPSPSPSSSLPPPPPPHATPPPPHATPPPAPENDAVDGNAIEDLGVGVFTTLIGLGVLALIGAASLTVAIVRRSRRRHLASEDYDKVGGASAAIKGVPLAAAGGRVANAIPETSEITVIEPTDKPGTPKAENNV